MLECENQLTEAEQKLIERNLAGNSGVMTGLKLVFGVSWGSITIFAVKSLLDDLEVHQSIYPDLVMLLTFSGMGIVFLLCLVSIRSRDVKICNALSEGHYKVIVSRISNKGYRYSGTYRYRRNCIVYFYRCPEIKGEVTPVSRKEFVRAQIGDRLKVVVIDALHIYCGILIAEIGGNSDVHL